MQCVIDGGGDLVWMQNGGGSWRTRKVPSLSGSSGKASEDFKKQVF